MIKTYKFIKEPRYNYQASEVTLGTEDFFQIMGMLEKWLNQPEPQALIPKADSSDPRQQIYINIDKLQTGQPFPSSEGVFSSQRLAATNSREMLAQLASVSKILSSAEGQKLGKSPLDFLSKELLKFTSVVEVFASRKLLPKTDIAPDFHSACDNVENVVVIIKSGQYIAGGYTEVPFDSHSGYKPNTKKSTFLFSANRCKVYALTKADKAVFCYKGYGPTFGDTDLRIEGDISRDQSHEALVQTESAFYRGDASAGELFGTPTFKVDEYEVYKLE